MNIEKIYNCIKENLLYFVLFILFLYSSIYINSSLFILSVGFDGIFNAVQFSKYYIKKDLSESHIIKNIPDIYNINTISRYEYYIFINCIAYILLPLKLFIRTIFIYIIIIPPILYKINVSNYGQYIKNKKNLFLKEFLSRHISKYIEKRSNNNFKIHHNEIMQLLSIENDIENIFWIILKNLLIIKGINYLKCNYSNISYNVIKKFYTYKTGTKINSITYQEATEYIKNIINNKEWFKLYDVQFTNCLQIIYNQNTNDFFINSLQFKILYFFSLWSFGFILPLYTIPLIFLFFEFYRTKSNKLVYIINKRITFIIINILFSFMLALLLQQEILLISFITVFGYPLLYNDLTFSIIYEIWKRKQFIIYIHKTYASITLFITFIIIFIVNKLNIFIFIMFITILIKEKLSLFTNIKKYYNKTQVYHIKLFLIYILLLFINNFSTSSILINTYILHIINNMINYYIDSKRIYIDENNYSIIFINKSCINKEEDDNLVYTINNSYYNFSIKSSQLDESMIILK